MISTSISPTHFTAAEQVAHKLRTEIISGNLAAGAPVRQEELAATYQVSRMPVREALRLLEAEGLVVIYPNRGAFVNRPTADDIHEIYDIRILLECDALRRAFPYFSRGVLATAEDLIEAMDSASDAPRFGQLDAQFHTTLYTPCGRPRLLSLIATLRNQVTQSLYAVTPLHTFAHSAQTEHRTILQACQAGNIEQAVDAIKDHLQNSIQYSTQIWE